MSSLDLEKAYLFACDRHKNQIRKFTGDPYITHPETVASIVHGYTSEPVITIAAILHDVVEDTNTTIEDITELFGYHVSDLVRELTIPKEHKKDPESKKEYLVKCINQMSSEALLIKLVDRLHNISGLLYENVDNNFIERYVNETIYILDSIDRELNEDHKELLGGISILVKLIILKRIIK